MGVLLGVGLRLAVRLLLGLPVWLGLRLRLLRLSVRLLLGLPVWLRLLRLRLSVRLRLRLSVWLRLRGGVRSRGLGSAVGARGGVRGG
ncbi:hypothetical protein, partial [Streptomyces viridochromogenes]|uniref:hypothetical protein n=1 Tax=Streptomyces viridochromogenes TaxID=1938 RepID=UPI0006C4C016